MPLFLQQCECIKSYSRQEKNKIIKEFHASLVDRHGKFISQWPFIVAISTIIPLSRMIENQMMIEPSILASAIISAIVAVLVVYIVTPLVNMLWFSIALEEYMKERQDKKDNTSSETQARLGGEQGSQ